MVRSLLIRGMIVGLLAGLLVFTFAKIFGEPQVDRAIAFETAMDEAKAKALEAKGIHVADEPELVSRRVQASFGLFTGCMVYCTAFGGLFALAFAYAQGRVGSLSPRAVSALLALAGFVVLYMVPNLKYPANPPSVGNPDTIGLRTGLYFGMMCLSVVAAIASTVLGKHLAKSQGIWNAAIASVGFYVVLMGFAMALLPVINEVPSDFPAATLWRFRIDSVGMQIVLWATVGLTFAANFGERSSRRKGVIAAAG